MEESRYLVLAAEVRAQLQQIERIYGLRPLANDVDAFLGSVEVTD